MKNTAALGIIGLVIFSLANLAACSKKTEETEPYPAIAPSELPEDAYDWDGAHFDVGKIVGTTHDKNHKDDPRLLIFDRYALRNPDGPELSGRNLTEEPLLYRLNPKRLQNRAKRLRRYHVDEAVKILQIDPTLQNELCAKTAPAEAPEWEEFDLEDWKGSTLRGQIATLSFDDEGRVTKIRLAQRC